MGRSAAVRDEMIAMWRQGLTYEQIGRAYGMTGKGAYAYVHYKPRKQPSDCIYPGLRDWLDRHGTRAGLYGGAGFRCSRKVFYGKLRGASPLTLGDIRRIIRYTGETFEQLFGEGVQEGEQQDTQD